MKRIHLYVSGSVQGVFFRAGCQRLAAQRDLSGFARNLPDGRVEAAFEGSDADVEAALTWCRTGPPSAAVASLEVEEQPTTGESGFRVV